MQRSHSVTMQSPAFRLLTPEAQSQLEPLKREASQVRARNDPGCHQLYRVKSATRYE